MSKTFQLLKSGARFQKNKVQKISKLFRPLEEGEQPKEKLHHQVHPVDERMLEIDEQIKKVAEDEDPDKEMTLKHLKNAKNERLIQLKKNYKIKTEGANVPAM